MTESVTVTFVAPSGERQTYGVPVGDTLLDAALDNGVPGILGQCGGGATCCTCHCWIDRPWLDALEAPHQDETDMLVFAWGIAADSRLACQVTLTHALDGITVRVPERQSI